jgi:23S rRNA (guanosine2251-2'-O)-methyltransferase
VRSPPPLKRQGVRRTEKAPTGRQRHRDERIPGPNDPSWIWGVHAALAALANPQRKIERLLATRNAAARLSGLPEGVEPQILEPDAIDGMLPPGAVHQGLAVRASPLEGDPLDEICTPPDGRSVVVLDGVTDPQNVGAVFRSAAAFGARALVMQDRRAPPLTGALAKAAAGAIETIPHARVVNLSRTVEGLKNWGYLTIALDGDAELELADAVADPRPVALVLGAEGKGLRDLVAATCERRARIPITPGMESLNVSVAAAISLYECARRGKA